MASEPRTSRKNVQELKHECLLKSRPSHKIPMATTSPRLVSQRCTWGRSIHGLGRVGLGQVVHFSKTFCP